MNKRKITIVSLLGLIGIVTLYIGGCFFFYKLNFSKFTKEFTKGNYEEAQILVSNNNINIISKININKSLSNFFIDYLSEISDDYREGSLSQENLLLTLNQMEKYNIVKTEIHNIKNELPIIIQSIENYEKALELFNEKSYEEALTYFNRVSPLDASYIESLSFKDECVDILKTDLLTEINDLIQEEKYSKGIELIEANLDNLNHNIDLLNKLDELETLRINHLVKYSEENINTSTNFSTPVSAYYNKLNSETINTFDLTSKTNYLVFVNIGEQKTYIYKGSKNNWDLEKEFLCSTGIEGKETPVGVFTIQARAPWFYSPKYSQGGKNYVQFMGNYLFHSVPFAQDQKTILDETLGKPASHGCIRLALDDSKWLYDNVGDGSKVIIY